MENRVVALIDMDCFYCQVETRLNPNLRDKPVAVVQYNQWKSGGIIAVNYEAKNFGITRHMRGDDALAMCPQLQLVSVPEIRGKADLSEYRNAGREVMTILSEYCSRIEKASIDEAYLDITDLIATRGEKVTADLLKTTYVIGYDSLPRGTEKWLNEIQFDNVNDSCAYRLAIAAHLVEEIRAAIFSKTGFHCSAGISCNKTLAKLACGVHKPKCQTVLPASSVPILYASLPLKKIKNLGGKFGEMVRELLDVETIGDVSKYSVKELQNKFGNKRGLWLFNIASGIDDEPVKTRLISQSIGCCKNFKGPTALTLKCDVEYWLKELCAEMYERMREDFIRNKRKATLFTVSARENVDGGNTFSRSATLKNYDLEEMRKVSFVLLSKKLNQCTPNSGRWNTSLIFLGLSVSKFVRIGSIQSLPSFFQPSRDFPFATASPTCAVAPASTALRLRCETSGTIEERSSTTSQGEGAAGSFFNEYFQSKLFSLRDIPTKAVRDDDVETDARSASAKWTSKCRNKRLAENRYDVASKCRSIKAFFSRPTRNETS